VTPIDYNRIKEFSDEITAHRADLRRYEASQQASGIAASQLDRVCEALGKLTGDLKEWDDELIRELIHTVKVLSKDKILIMFRTGLETEQALCIE